ncbi:MAG: MFS transporter [Candidatus Thorarchaeota archaeon]|nr:MFS transporter [Candidatus Thorarchaeota archaeon]
MSFPSDSEQYPEPDQLELATTTESDHSTGMYQVWMLAFSLALLQVGFGIVMPIFPYYIVSLGVGATELGVLAASFAITRIIFAGPLGRLSDKTGRKPVLLASLIGFAIANVIYAMAEDIFIMILARALEGGVSAGFFPAANAFVSDVTSPENRGTAMGYLSMGNMVGFIIGPMIGGALAQFLGIRLPFVIAAIATLATFVAVMALLVEPAYKFSEEHEKQPEIPLRDVFSRHVKSYTALGMAMFANMFAMGILEVAFLLDAVVRFHVSPLEIGVFFGLIGVFTVIGNVGFGYLSDHHGRKWLIVSGGLIGAVSLYMFMISGDIMGFMFAGIVLAVGMSMRGPTIQALIGDLTDESAYGVVMGTFGAVSNGAYAISPLLSGIMYDSSGDSISSLLLAIVVTLAGVGVAAVGLPGGIIISDETAADEEPDALNTSL